MKISPIKLRYAYLEHSDWLRDLEWPIRGLKNERSIVMLHLNLFMALTPVVNVIKLFLKEI